MNRRPASNEYEGYVAAYIERVEDGPIVQVLADQRDRVSALLQAIRDERGTFRYSPDKWSLKQMIGHMIDTERILAYRALCVARGEVSGLPGFDQDAYVELANFEQLTMAQLHRQFAAVRESSLLLLDSLPDDAWSRIGNANGLKLSVRAIAYMIAGHTDHHVEAIESRYLS